MRNDSIFKSIIDLDQQYFELRKSLFETLGAQVDDLTNEIYNVIEQHKNDITTTKMQLDNSIGDLVRRCSELKEQLDSLDHRVKELEAKKRRTK